MGPGAAVVGDAVAAGVGNDEGLLLTAIEFALGGGDCVDEGGIFVKSLYVLFIFCHIS